VNGTRSTVKLSGLLPTRTRSGAWRGAVTPASPAGGRALRPDPEGTGVGIACVKGSRKIRLACAGVSL
jgi:hypothetical protein